ncbi:MAG TPA: hypothetical protein VN515_09720, partial [Terriglobales bacterium]|nr:hypothetical protein [Terriglobales bacterium]
DGVLNNVLGSLGERLERGLVDGFGGRPVPVRRFKQGNRGLLLIDAVNLAAASAEGQTDALVSRIQRVRARQDQPGRPVMAVVGYLASPAGLNGERALLEWIQQKAEASTFDLLREGAQLGDRVHAALAEVGQPSAQPRLGE